MSSRPPRAFSNFVQRYPKLGEAWSLLSEAGDEAGPLDLKSQRLVKLGIAIGSGRRGPVTSAVRKGLDAGLTPEECEQAVALAASTIGLPAAVAAFGWIQETLAETT